MLADRIRVLDFDSSLTPQAQLFKRYSPTIIDFTAIGPAARLWANTQTAKKILAGLSPESKHLPTFLGSGDFHHISALLLSRFEEPVTLIVFDFHPDWDILPPRLGCGSWVTRALRLSCISKIFLLGPSSDDLAAPALYTGNLQALENDGLEIYPYAHGPTRMLLRPVPQNTSLELRRGGCSTEIFWTQLQGRDPETFIPQLLRRCTTRKAYISIDKDCLRPEYALTNWEAGRFSLNELLRYVACIKSEMDIVGADITGEYSEPVLSGRFKSLCSRMDHPAHPSAFGRAAHNINALNEQTNLRLLEILLS